MSAWDVLVSKSSIPEQSGDAWEHLNNQASTITHLGGCVGMDMDVRFYELDIEIDDIYLDIENEGCGCQ